MSAAAAEVRRRQPVVTSPQQRDGRRKPTPSSHGATAITALVGAIITILLTTGLAIGVSMLVTSEPPAQDHLPSSATGVLPLPCHSHNDYWRRKPLFSALETGCIGVEADVWHFDGDLYVAHTHGSMQPGRTLQSMYIDPLLRLLREANSRDVAPSSSSSSYSSSTPQGLYAAHPSQTVVLLVDIKADAERAWPVLLQQLEPLRREGWLSTLRENGQINTAPITVVVTGDILRITDPGMGFDGPNYGMFLDAPLTGLEDGGGRGPYHSNNSYWASVSLKKSIGLGWFGELGTSRLEKVKQQIQLAHSRGLQARYWGLPSWPMEVRNGVWEALLAEGLDILNVDDLKGFSEFWLQHADVQDVWTSVKQRRPT